MGNLIYSANLYRPERRILNGSLVRLPLLSLHDGRSELTMDQRYTVGLNECLPLPETDG